MKHFVPITTKTKVAQAQVGFARSTRQVFTGRLDLTIQTPGSPAFVAGVRSTHSKVWTLHNFDKKRQRFFNPFGQVTRSVNLAHSPYIECNIPVEGQNRHVGALFATPKNSDQAHLLHTGKIGGGKKGVGKKAFLAWLNAKHRADVTWCIIDKVSKKPKRKRKKKPKKKPNERAILLGRVGSKELARNIIDLMYLADEFKRTFGTPQFQTPKPAGRKPAKKGQQGKRAKKAWLPTLPAQTTFNSEDYPKKTYKQGGKVTRRHGYIVDDLKLHIERLHKNQRVDVGNTRIVDLYTTRKRDCRLLQVFEVKTSMDSHAIYTAIGQLLVYSDMAKGGVAARTLVLPAGEGDPREKLKRYEGVFETQRIRVLVYAREVRRYRFSPLEF